MSANHLPIPTTLCITTQAYQDFFDSAGLREKIDLELNRKIFSQMRWEEIWDTSQRIRLLFLRSPMPKRMESAFSQAISQAFGDAPTVVRSSASDEERSGHSFARLHASYTHLQGPDDVIHHVKLVWASLWSDAALLYRQELGLDVVRSAMAVLVQERVPGQASGIFFTQDHTHIDRSIIEAIHGMNPPLVDGKIAPDRYTLDANEGTIISHSRPESRRQWHPPVSAAADEQLVPLPKNLQHQPPLQTTQISTLWHAGVTVSTIAGSHQDIEWTFQGDDLVLLQAPTDRGGSGRRRRIATGSPLVTEVLSELGLNTEEETTPPWDTLPPAAVRDRQITGQPAGPGLSRGHDRVIHQHNDIKGC